jgi:hypothetical protein
MAPVGSNQPGNFLAEMTYNQIYQNASSYLAIRAEPGQLNASPGTPTAGPRSDMIASARKFCSKIWSGFGTKSQCLQRKQGY